jgi:hypothetical protein
MSEPLLIDPSVPPSGPGCVECEATGGWWVHLRRCTACGHIGCCDSSPSGHARIHAGETGHSIVRSYEPGESWFWDFGTEQYYDGPDLVDPLAHPEDQTAPGPAERVPADWRNHVR